MGIYAYGRRAAHLAERGPAANVSQQGRPVCTREGELFRGRADAAYAKRLPVEELDDLNGKLREAVEAPEWATAR